MTNYYNHQNGDIQNYNTITDAEHQEYQEYLKALALVEPRDSIEDAVATVAHSEWHEEFTNSLVADLAKVA